MMNPETNKFEMLRELEKRKQPDAQELQSMNRAERRRYLKSLEVHQLIRPDGSPVPPHWPVFKTGELVDIKNYTFRVAHIGESHMLLEPVRPTDALTERME